MNDQEQREQLAKELIKLGHVLSMTDAMPLADFILALEKGLRQAFECAIRTAHDNDCKVQTLTQQLATAREVLGNLYRAYKGSSPINDMEVKKFNAAIHEAEALLTINKTKNVDDDISKFPLTPEGTSTAPEPTAKELDAKGAIPELPYFGDYEEGHPTVRHDDGTTYAEKKVLPPPSHLLCPEGYEIVTYSDEVVRSGWKVKYSGNPWQKVGLTVGKKISECGYGYVTFARPVSTSRKEGV